MTTSRVLVSSVVLGLSLVSTSALAADGWGSSWSFGPSTSRIIYAKTTLVPGRLAPITSSTGPLFLWPGMSNSKGDLIQTTMDSWPDNASYCHATSGQWCVEASVFGSFGQRNGPTVAIDPDDHVTIEYKLESDGNTWTQTVTSQKLGKVVSTLQSASGPMPGTGFGFATEADADSYTIDTQYYLCSEFHFAEADSHFGATGVGANGARAGASGTGSGAGTAKNVHTPDKGLTWLVDLITLPAMQPQGTQTAAPAVNCNSTGASGSGGAGGTGGAASGSAGSGSGGRGGASSAGGSGGHAGSESGTGGVGGTSSAGSGSDSGGTNSGVGGSANGTSGFGGTGLTPGAGGTGGSPSTVGTGGASNAGGGGARGVVAGSGGALTAGTSSTPSAAGNGAPDSSSDSSGCSCEIQRRSSNGALLLLGFVAAAVLGRRRRA